MNKLALAAMAALFPFAAFAVEPKTPVLGKAEIVSPTEIRWHFTNRANDAVAFELWNVIARRMVKCVDDPKATYIEESNVVPADPDLACGRYIVAVNAKDERSFAQVETYPCVRTPPVPLPKPLVEIVDNKIIKITVSQGANDPATSIGVYDAKHDAWVSPEHMFTADPWIKPVGEWGADLGTTLIGLRPNSSYLFYARARSITGEEAKWSEPAAVRLPAEKGDAYAPVLDRIGELMNLRGQTLLQTFLTKRSVPVISGIVAADTVTVDLDDRPYLAEVRGTGEVKNFSFVPPKLAPGFHYLRFGAHRGGSVAWTPTIEFYVGR